MHSSFCAKALSSPTHLSTLERIPNLAVRVLALNVDVFPQAELEQERVCTVSHCIARFSLSVIDGLPQSVRSRVAGSHHLPTCPSNKDKAPDRRFAEQCHSSQSRRIAAVSASTRLPTPSTRWHNQPPTNRGCATTPDDGLHLMMA